MTEPRILYSPEVAAMLTRMSPPDDAWSERRAREWLQRPNPETGIVPGFRLCGRWATTLERLTKAFPPAAEDAAERAAERALEAEESDECAGCTDLRRQLRETERQLLELTDRMAGRR